MNKIQKIEFKQIFRKAMQETKAFSYGTDEDGHVISEKFQIEPAIVIRDVDIDDDSDFDDLEEAWEYLQTLTHFRIMSANGLIYYDNCYKVN